MVVAAIEDVIEISKRKRDWVGGHEDILLLLDADLTCLTRAVFRQNACVDTGLRTQDFRGDLTCLIRAAANYGDCMDTRL